MVSNKLNGQLLTAIEQQDACRIGELVDRLRFCYHRNYDQCFELAHALTGISVSEWDELLYEADLKS